MNNLDECRTCGAAVASMSKHRRWHAEVDRVASQAQDAADAAQDSADEALNTLYQNNISI